MKWLHSLAGRAFSGDFSAPLLKYGYFACIAQHVTLDLEVLCSLFNEPFVKLFAIKVCPLLKPTSLDLLSQAPPTRSSTVNECNEYPNTVNSLYSGDCRDLELVSSLASVRNSGSLFQSNVCNLFLAGILATVRIIGESVIAVCPQGES